MRPLETRHLCYRQCDSAGLQCRLVTRHAASRDRGQLRAACNCRLYPATALTLCGDILQQHLVNCNYKICTPCIWAAAVLPSLYLLPNKSKVCEWLVYYLSTSACCMMVDGGTTLYQHLPPLLAWPSVASCRHHAMVQSRYKRYTV